MTKSTTVAACLRRTRTVVGPHRCAAGLSEAVGSDVKSTFDLDSVQLRHAELREPIRLHKLLERMPIHLVLGDGCHAPFELQLGEERAHVANRPVAQGLLGSLLPKPVRTCAAAQ
jgi:hypothetical protein